MRKAVNVTTIWTWGAGLSLSLYLILWAQIAAAGPLRVSPVKSQIFEDYPRSSFPLMLDFMPVDQALW